VSSNQEDEQQLRRRVGGNQKWVSHAQPGRQIDNNHKTKGTRRRAHCKSSQ